MLDGKAGGGIGMTNTIHEVDLLRYFIGNVKRVNGVCKTVSPRLINGAEDFLCATLEFENGAVGTVFCLWSVIRTPIAQQYMLFGDEGTLYSLPELSKYRGDFMGPIVISSPKRPGTEPMDRDALARRRSQANRQPLKFTDMFGHFVQIEPSTEGLASDNSFINEIIHFAECCQEGKEPISSGRDNLGTVKIILGIYESSRTGKVVDLADL